MTYGFQVWVRKPVPSNPNNHTWEWVSPLNGKPYQYETEAEAAKMAYICYGTDPAIVRVREYTVDNACTIHQTTNPTAYHGAFTTHNLK